MLPLINFSKSLQVFPCISLGFTVFPQTSLRQGSLPGTAIKSGCCVKTFLRFLEVLLSGRDVP